MRKTPIVAALSLLIAGSLLSACGDKKEYTGKFIDSAVSGLNYKTDSLDRLTDDNGKFSYRRRETVTFSIGSFRLGSSDVKGIITPVDLAGPKADLTTNQVINTARLLQTIDANNDLNDGIQISEQARNESGRLAGVDLTADPAVFAAHPAVLDFLTAATGSTNTVLIDQALAIKNLQNGINGANAVGELDAYVHAGSDQSYTPTTQAKTVDLQGTVDSTVTNYTVKWDFVDGYPSPSGVIDNGLKILNSTSLNSAQLIIPVNTSNVPITVRLVLSIRSSDGKTGSDETQITVCPRTQLGTSC